MRADFLPDPNNCLLLVVDLQERLMAAMPGAVAEQVQRNTCILAETAQIFNLPVVVSEQYPKGLGPTLPDIRAALPQGTEPIEKLAFSCCKETGFAPLLTRPEIILCGAETHVCVLQTVLDLLEQGRRVYVAADATCSRTKSNWRLGLDMMQRAGAVIGSTEVFAFGLLGEAGTERFKRISRLVK